jgi:hypothetical protein
MKKFNMVEPNPRLVQIKIASLWTRERVQEHDRLPPVPHSDMTGHSVRRRAVRALSDFPTLFTSDGSSASF